MYEMCLENTETLFQTKTVHRCRHILARGSLSKQLQQGTAELLLKGSFLLEDSSEKGNIIVSKLIKVTLNQNLHLYTMKQKKRQARNAFFKQKHLSFLDVKISIYDPFLSSKSLPKVFFKIMREDYLKMN